MVLLLKLIKKNHLQVYLEECKYRVKKTQMYSDSSDSDSNSENIGAKVDNELMGKLEKLGSDSE